MFYTGIVPADTGRTGIKYVEALIVGSYSVGPLYVIPEHDFSAAGWNVRDVETGVSCGCFSDLEIAIKFAAELYRTYGNLTDLCQRLLDKAYTDSDKAICQAITTRGAHVSRVSDGADTGAFVPFNPSIFAPYTGG